MRKLFLSLTVIAFMAGTVTTTFGQQADQNSVKARENLQQEKKDVVDAKKDLKVAQQDSVMEYQKLSQESAVIFKSNEKSVADLRARIIKSNVRDQATNQRKVTALEQKNTDLRKELAEYKVGGQTKFASFKSGFNRDLAKLSKELKDFKIV